MPNLLKRFKKYTLYKKYKRDFWSFYYKKKKTDAASYSFLKIFAFRIQRKIVPKLKRIIHNFSNVLNVKLNNFVFFFKPVFKKTFERNLKISRISVFLRGYFRLEWFSRFTWYSYYRIKSMAKFLHLRKSKSRKNKIAAFWDMIKPKHYYTNYRVNFFRIKPFKTYKKRIAVWIKRKRLESFTALFYGYTSLKKFKHIQDNFFFKTRKPNVFFFENSIYIFLFRINIFKEHYTIKKLVKRGFISVNKKTIYNSFFKFKLNDDISITKKYFKKAYFTSKKNIKKLVNFPGYIIYNPVIMCGSIWRNPYRYEVCGFYDFRISKNFINKSASSAFYAK